MSIVPPYSASRACTVERSCRSFAADGGGPRCAAQGSRGRSMHLQTNRRCRRSRNRRCNNHVIEIGESSEIYRWQARKKTTGHTNRILHISMLAPSRDLAEAPTPHLTFIPQTIIWSGWRHPRNPRFAYYPRMSKHIYLHHNLCVMCDNVTAKHCFFLKNQYSLPHPVLSHLSYAGSRESMRMRKRGGRGGGGGGWGFYLNATRIR